MIKTGDINKSSAQPTNRRWRAFFQIKLIDALKTRPPAILSEAFNPDAVAPKTYCHV